MGVEFKLDVFEGPLDLLLHLVRKNKLSVYDIPISDITRQFIEYVGIMQDNNLEGVSEFLMLASDLLYIKSRLLLPKQQEQPDDAEQLAESLANRLIEYGAYKQAAQYLAEREVLEQDVYYSARQDIQPLVIDQRMSRLTLDGLMKAYKQALQHFETTVSDNSVTDILQAGKRPALWLKIKHVLRLTRRGAVAFETLFDGAASRADIIATFIAVLELIKSERVKARQSGSGFEVEYCGKRKADAEQRD